MFIIEKIIYFQQKFYKGLLFIYVIFKTLKLKCLKYVFKYFNNLQ